MKRINFISHPITLIVCFLFIIISGQHLGGFYVVYILLGLPHGGIHCLLAAAGIGLLLLSYFKYKRQQITIGEPVLNVAGVVLLFLSLVFFFYNDREHYNYGTFYQIVPMLTLSLFGIVAVIFLIRNLTRLKLSHLAM